MTDDDSRAQGDSAPDAGPSRTYPDHLLRHGRERGLSKADRRYLASGGETVENEGTDVNTRIRIRERVRESIVDFWLLTEYLSDHDRDLIFRESDDDWDNWELQIGLKSAMQFFYTALDQTGLTDFDTVLTSAIHDAERAARDGPVLVDVDFDVEVDEQFHVQEAYDKFQRGVPLSPMEIGTLLVTGKIHGPEEVQRLSHHARSNSFVEHTLAPLLADQLSSISDEEERTDSFQYHRAHLPDEYTPDESGSVTHFSDYYYLEEQIAFKEQERENVSLEELADEDVAEMFEDSETIETDDEQPRDHEAALRELSTDLDQPITVGDAVVYEDGDRHLLDGDDADERGADSPADTDGGADDGG